MNLVILMGRLTRDPEVRYSQGERSITIARYTLAVDRRGRKNSNNESEADFISCVAFGKSGEFAEKYFRQGQRILISGRIQTGSYVDKNGNKVYTTDVVVLDQEFADGRRGGNYQSVTRPPVPDYEEGFMNVPNNFEDEGLPF